MVTVTYSYGYPEHTLELSGHADYAKYGEDIVCSAISTLVQTLERCLEPDITYKIIEPGNVVISTLSPDTAADYYFHFVMTGLQEIAEGYPRYIEIK